MERDGSGVPPGKLRFIIDPPLLLEEISIVKKSQVQKLLSKIHASCTFGPADKKAPGASPSAKSSHRRSPSEMSVGSGRQMCVDQAGWL